MKPDKTLAPPVNITELDGPALKKAFAFRLATTSYIFPAGYAENVQRLGALVDEIELIFFESRPPQSLPSVALIDQLGSLSVELGITYNIHLPIDIDPADLLPERRLRARQELKRFIQRTLPLAPTSFTLHLPCNCKTTDASMIQRWQSFNSDALASLLEDGIDPGLICVENLDYPFEWVAGIVEGFDLRICFDLGHMLVQGVPLDPFFDRYRDRIDIIHLHGVADGRDHLALDRMDPLDWKTIEAILRSFRKTVSVEVFSRPDLERSLAFLEEKLGHR
jgi:sugar phosphate isomerase/epimerase